MRVTKVAVLGVGKIARDQHIPAIAGSSAFELAATVSRSGGISGVENHQEVGGLLASRPDIKALSLCMPPQPRYDIALAALMSGRHTMLEKPPGATVSEALHLAQVAKARGVTLFATWHSRHAAAVDTARDWLASRQVQSFHIDWKEDVRRWHPGQEWIWQAGGMGVFDPGINALSILTEILPHPAYLTRSMLIFPENREAPIAADLGFAGPGGLRGTAQFDWRQEGPQSWNIRVETGDGTLTLSDGGATLDIDGAAQVVPKVGEYPALYARFASLIAAGQSDVDLRPLQLVADAFMLGKRAVVAAFHD